MTALPPDDTGASPPTADDVAQQLAAIVDYVRQCEARVLRGEVMDLSGLDKTVMVICGDITRLPGPQARALEPQMHKLVDVLDTLAARMKEQQDQLTGQGHGMKGP